MYEDYQNSTDEELIDRLRQGEKQITDYIMDKYKNLVRKKAKSMYILGADKDDLIQEGMIGLFKAVRDYDAGRDASFYTFADLCVSRQMYTAVQASGREKHAPLNSYISLYANLAENGQEENDNTETALVNRLTSGTDTNPEALLIDKENVADIEAAIETELSGFEKQVLDLYLTGMSYSQIAKVLGRDEKSADNALQRLKGKIKRTIQKSHMILFIFMCLLFPVNTQAMEQSQSMQQNETQTESAEETQTDQNMTQVSVDAAPMLISIPNDCYILQQEVADDDLYLKKVGADKEKVEEYYQEAGIVLNAIAHDDSYEMVVTVNENQDVTYLYNIHSVADENVSELAQTIQKTYEEHGYTVDDFTLYENETAKYIVFAFGQEYEDSAVRCIQYDTIRDSRMYTVTLRSYTGEVSDQMSDMMKQIIDSIVFTEAEETLTFEDTQYGISYELAPGWKEITSDNEDDILAQYMHTNGMGESIQFIARDIWGEMDTLHQLTNTRGELDADQALTDAQIHKIYPYMEHFFAGEDTFHQEKIQGEWYFVSDEPLTYTSDKLKGTYQQRSVVALRHGILYVWQYGTYVDSNLHEADFDNLIENITYQEPGLFVNDAGVYRKMVNRIPFIILLGAIIMTALVAVLFMYSSSAKDDAK